MRESVELSTFFFIEIFKLLTLKVVQTLVKTQDIHTCMEIKIIRPISIKKF